MIFLNDNFLFIIFLVVYTYDKEIQIHWDKYRIQRQDDAV